MHGFVMDGLEDYVGATYDWPTWRSVRDRAEVRRCPEVPTDDGMAASDD